MAEKARQNSGADLGVGITGNAGPSTDSEDSTVGQVHIAISAKNHLKAEKHQLRGDRISIKLKAAKTCLNMIRSFLIKHPSN